MTEKKSTRLDQYDFSFPPELIAQKPASPRDSARLLVYDREKKAVALSTFLNLPQYLPKRSVLVVNETKVVPARLHLRKETGGRVIILFLEHDKKSWQVLSDRKLSIGQRLVLDKQHFFTVSGQEESIFLLQPSFSMSRTFAVLEKYGETPIPPYIKHSPLSELKLRKEYQAVFAKTKGSVAAPTASLHFTNRLMNEIKKQGHEVKKVTLHVGLGTFAPVTEKQIQNKRLHEETYFIDEKTIAFLNKAKREGRPIIAVGTTVVRTLESASKKRGVITEHSGTTDLFIQEGYRFKFVDDVITNFHVPRSSLLMLISALVSRRVLLKLYRLAISQNFRLFSFGDGMFIR